MISKHIPKNFELARMKWIVDTVKEISGKENYYYLGKCCEATKSIILADTVECGIVANKYERRIISKDDKDKTFYHELVHAILDTMGSEISNNEEFVQCFGNLLYEYMITRK